MGYGYSVAVNTVGTVTGGASGTVIDSNASRRYLRIANTGGTPCYLALGGAAAINSGIRVNGAGSSADFYEMSKEAGNLYSGAVTGILTVPGTAQLSILEGS